MEIPIFTRKRDIIVFITFAFFLALVGIAISPFYAIFLMFKNAIKYIYVLSIRFLRSDYVSVPISFIYLHTKIIPQEFMDIYARFYNDES
jgi:hypothetical protein